MKRIVFIAILSFGIFGIEFFLFNLLGKWAKPNFLLLEVLFFNFYLGIRYSLLAGFMAGFLRDSFSLNAFGVHIFSFMVCAFMATLARKYLFHTSVYSLRVLLAFLISLLNGLVLYALHSMSVFMDFDQVLTDILIPEVLTTTLVASGTFWYLRKCVLKFSV